MTIQVTVDDIKHGQCGNCRFCPIGRAIERATGRIPWVSGEACKLKGICGVFRLPLSCLDFVLDFDAHRKVQAFSFEFDYRGAA